MKLLKKPGRTANLRLPGKDASYAELADFFDRNEGFDLLDRGIMELDPDREDLDCLTGRSLYPRHG